MSWGALVLTILNSDVFNSEPLSSVKPILISLAEQANRSGGGLLLFIGLMEALKALGSSGGSGGRGQERCKKWVGVGDEKVCEQWE